MIFNKITIVLILFYAFTSCNVNYVSKKYREFSNEIRNGKEVFLRSVSSSKRLVNGEIVNTCKCSSEINRLIKIVSPDSTKVMGIDCSFVLEFDYLKKMENYLRDKKFKGDVEYITTWIEYNSLLYKGQDR